MSKNVSDNKESIYLVNPPKEMPKPGTKDYELLVKEIGFEPTSGFNYEAHIQATRGSSSDLPANKAPIYLVNPPKEMPKPGTKDYELLVKEIGFEPTSDFNYEAHIQATRGSSSDFPVNKAPIFLINPPKEMPEPGTKNYELLVKEIGFAPKSDFNYEAHLWVTRGDLVFTVEDKSDPIGMSIHKLYAAAFGRVADVAGFTYWRDVIDDPLTGRKVIAQEFIKSTEFKTPKDSYPHEIINKFYVNILGREADSEGLSFWSAEIAQGRMDAADVLIAFADSAEWSALAQA